MLQSLIKLQHRVSMLGICVKGLQYAHAGGSRKQHSEELMFGLCNFSGCRRAS